MPAAEAFPHAKAAAGKAIALDPSRVEAQTSLAFATFIFDHDLARAEEGYQRALQWNPAYGTAHHWYGELLAAMGRIDESLTHLHRAKDIDPLSPGVRESIGTTLYLARRYDGAIAELREALAINSNLASTYYYLGLAYALQGLYREAAEEIERGRAKAPSSSMLSGAAGIVSAMRGGWAGA